MSSTLEIMANNKLLVGFHAITARLRADPKSIHAIYYQMNRQDKRMQALLSRAQQALITLHAVDDKRLQSLAGIYPHQGVVAFAQTIKLALNIDELLDSIPGPPLLLILDGVTDPHNLGACLRVADGAGAHAVIAPRDRSVSINTTVAKVASGAAETVPYISVTNLARTLRQLKEYGIHLIGTDDQAPNSLYQLSLNQPLAIVMGAEGEGMRRLTRETCDEMMHIPMHGSVSSLNVSVASGICLYEAQRQRIRK